MSATCKYFLLFIVILLIFSNLYSQSLTLNNRFANDYKKITSREKANNILLDNNLPNQRFILKKNERSSGFPIIVDSVIGMLSNGSRFKESYSFNTDGIKFINLIQDWDGNLWRNSTRQTSTYNTKQNRTSFLIEYWDTDRWVNDGKYTYAYNSNDIIFYYLYEEWDGSQWLEKSKGINTYDSNNNRVSYVSEYWDIDHWVNDRQYLYTYNTGGNITSEITKIWINAEWENRVRFSYTYDLDGNKTFYLWEQWNENQWAGYVHETYTYDLNSNMISNIVQSWDGNQWVNAAKYTYTYDSTGDVTMELIENGNGIEWMNYYQKTYVYNSTGNMTFLFGKLWNLNLWEDNSRSSYDYNSEGNLIHVLNEKWESDNWTTNDDIIQFDDSFGNRYYYYASEIDVFYGTLTDISENQSIVSNYSLSQNYPNPFNPTTTIKYSIPNLTHPHLKKNGGQAFISSREGKERSGMGVLVTLKVYDILGREAAVLVNQRQSAGNYEVIFDASNLTSGIYFYQLKSSEFTVTKKLIFLQ